MSSADLMERVGQTTLVLPPERAQAVRQRCADLFGILSSYPGDGSAIWFIHRGEESGYRYHLLWRLSETGMLDKEDILDTLKPRVQKFNQDSFDTAWNSIVPLCERDI